MNSTLLYLRVSMLKHLPHGEVLDIVLKDLHKISPSFIQLGRNILAGSARAWGIQFGSLYHAIQEDPIFQESLALTRGKAWISIKNLINIFLIIKYGMTNLIGDFVEFGSFRGGTALFMANVARRLELSGKIYALDTFEGMPTTNGSIDMHAKGDFAEAHFDKFLDDVAKMNLDNLIPIKGIFQETFPTIASSTKNIVLAHIDCDIYESIKYAISSLPTCMHQKGGYLIFDDPLQSSCLGAMQAVEEMIQEEGLRAEQTYPHLVYRQPKL